MLQGPPGKQIILPMHMRSAHLRFVQQGCHGRQETDVLLQKQVKVIKEKQTPLSQLLPIHR
jgi:hypothetical protein